MGSRPTAAGAREGAFAPARTGGSWRDHGRVDLERVGGWVVIPRRPGARAGGEPGGSRPPSSGARNIEKCRFTDFFFLFFLSGSSSPRLCVDVGIPGRWMEAGISNGCGKVRGRVAGGPELSTAGQLPQPGRGRASPARAAPGSRHGSVQGCVQACVAASGPVCRSARGPQSRMRTCVRTCVRLPRAACGLACRSARAACGPACGFAWPDSSAPTPLRPLRISSLADGGFQWTERNLGRVLERRSKIFSLHIRWARIGYLGPCRATTIRW